MKQGFACDKERAGGGSLRGGQSKQSYQRCCAQTELAQRSVNTLGIVARQARGRSKTVFLFDPAAHRVFFIILFVATSEM